MGKYKNYKNRLEMYLASDRGKRTLNFCYGWGASIVIVGAMFKLLHLPFGNEILFVSMITEAVVFFISAFEKPGNEYHWEEVFPVLQSKNPLDRPDFEHHDNGNNHNPAIPSPETFWGPPTRDSVRENEEHAADVMNDSEFSGNVNDTLRNVTEAIKNIPKNFGSGAGNIPPVNLGGATGTSGNVPVTHGGTNGYLEGASGSNAAPAGFVPTIGSNVVSTGGVQAVGYDPVPVGNAQSLGGASGSSAAPAGFVPTTGSNVVSTGGVQTAGYNIVPDGNVQSLGGTSGNNVTPSGFVPTAGSHAVPVGGVQVPGSIPAGNVQVPNAGTSSGSTPQAGGSPVVIHLQGNVAGNAGGSDNSAGSIGSAGGLGTYVPSVGTGGYSQGNVVGNVGNNAGAGGNGGGLGVNVPNGDTGYAGGNAVGNLPAGSIANTPEQIARMGLSTMGLNVSDKDVETLATSIHKLSDAAEQIAKVADMTDVTQTYVDQLTLVAQNLERFNVVTASLSDISETLVNSCKVITGYTSNENPDVPVASYVYHMEHLNRNLENLNDYYEVQLTGLRTQMNTIHHINAGLNRIRDMYDSSMIDSAAFRNENERMAQLLTQLNQVYGRMLQAMTVNMNYGSNLYPPPTATPPPVYNPNYPPYNPTTQR